MGLQIRVWFWLISLLALLAVGAVKIFCFPELELESTTFWKVALWILLGITLLTTLALVTAAPIIAFHEGKKHGVIPEVILKMLSVAKLTGLWLLIVGGAIFVGWFFYAGAGRKIVTGEKQIVTGEKWRLLTDWVKDNPWWVIVPLSAVGLAAAIMLLVHLRPRGVSGLAGSGNGFGRYLKTMLAIAAGMGLIHLFVYFFSWPLVWTDWFDQGQFFWVVNSAILVVLFLFFASIPYGKLIGSILAVVMIMGTVSQWPRGEENKSAAKVQRTFPQWGTISWRMPEGMVSGLYPNDPDARSSVNRVKIIQDDDEVFECIVYCRYGGGELAQWRWDRRKKSTGCFWSEGNNLGRKPNYGEWYLEPAAPNLYRGAWRSPISTGNQWVPMELRLDRSR